MSSELEVMSHADKAEMVRMRSTELLVETVDRLRGFVLEGFQDPGSIYDLSPMQLKSLAELASTYVRALRELGDLYQLSKPPVSTDDDVVPMIEVSVMEQMIENAVLAERAETEARVRMEVLAEVAARREMEGRDAKAQVLKALGR